jgi:thiamine-phosphate pyrophosphorylase
VKRLSGLYAITQDTRDVAALLANTEAALRGGASVVQYRNKSVQDVVTRRATASALADLVRAYDALFIVNDDVALAREVHAHGVHLGQSDGDVATVRAAWPDAIIGATCHDRLELADAAVAAGASYVAFGAIYPSSVKPGASAASLSLITTARRRLPVPICAIGGITLVHATAVAQAGAHLLAVISDLYSTPAVDTRAAQFCAAIDAGHQSNAVNES